MNISLNPQRLRKYFSDINSNLNHMDEVLTSPEYGSRDSVPGRFQSGDFKNAARNIDQATLHLRDLHPGEKYLLEDLKKDTLDLGFYSGMTDSMHRGGIAFGPGWTRAVDPSISDTNEALDLLGKVSSSKDEKSPPSPAKVMKQLSDVQAHLTRLDSYFTHWDNRGVSPGADISEELREAASALYDVRNSVWSLHPSEVPILENLQKGVLEIAMKSGSTYNMNNHRISFGGGWNKAMDQPLQSVDKAMNLLAGETLPEEQ